MNPLRIASIVLSTIALSGCFISATPLVGADDAVFPFEAISYREIGTERSTKMVREGDFYRVNSPDDTERLGMRFKDLGDGLYLAQLSNEKDGKRAFLYAVLKVDLEEKTVDSYKTDGSDAVTTEGLRRCGEDMVCIDNLDAYLDVARRAIAAGERPDVTYEIVATE